jgi:hypothetical protein
MAKDRMQVREHLTLDRFMPPALPVLVTCDQCGDCATLRKFTFLRTKRQTARRGECVCLHCGHQWSVLADVAFFTAGPLWLKTSVHQNVVWVLNREHLDFLEHFIQADLREERMPERSSRRLSSALPFWMLAAKNRDDVVRALKKLRKRLDATKPS